MLSILGLDIGGSIVKVVYRDPPETLPSYVVCDGDLKYGVLNFVRVPVAKLPDFLDYVDCHGRFGATGGGAKKYGKLLTSQGYQFTVVDEMQSLVEGVERCITMSPGEMLTCSWRTKQLEAYNSMVSYPYLIVNIGSGVSVISVESPEQYCRLTGTALGGGTFWALARMLTGITDFNQIREYSDLGDNRKVDLLVRDIYGGDYQSAGLGGHVIASSMAKAGGDSKSQDLVKSLLYMVADNITQIAYLATRGDRRYGLAFFTGSFVDAGTTLYKKLDYGVEFWSKGDMKAIFLRHHSYVGALGAYCML